MSQRALVTGSDTRPVLANAQMVGGLSLNPVGNFVSLAVSGTDNAAKTVSFASKSDVLLSGSFAGVSGSIIQALNYLQAVASAGSGDVVAGSGDDNQVVFWSDYSANTIASDADLTFDGQAFGFGGTNGTTFTVDATGLSLDGTSASNLTATGANLTVSTATSGELIVNSAGVLDIDSAAAMEITSAAGIDIDGTTIDIDASGALTIDSATSIAIGTNADKPIDVDATTFDLDASGALTIDSATSIAIGTTADKPIDIDSTTLDIDASGAVTIDGVGMSLDSTGATNLTATGAALTVSTATSGELIVNSAGVLDIDSAAAMEITSAAGIDMDCTTFDLDASGALAIDSATSIAIGTNADKPIDVDATTFDLDASGAVTIDGVGMSIDSTGASNLTATGAALTVSTATSGELIVNSAGVLDIDSAGAMEIDSASTLSIDAEDDSNFTVTGAGKTMSLIAVGGGTNVISLNSAGSGANAIDIDASAGGMDVDVGGAFDVAAGGAVGLNSSASSISVGTTLDDGQSLLLGRASRAQIEVAPNNGTPGSNLIGINNDVGTAINAIALTAPAGGIAASIKNARTHAFQFSNAGGTSLLRIDGLGGADFAVSASAPRIVGSVSRLAISNGAAAGFALAMSSSVLTGSTGALNGKKLQAGDSAKDVAMSDFPSMFLQGVDDEGKLRNYFMQVSGGILQLQEGAVIF